MFQKHLQIHQQRLTSQDGHSQRQEDPKTIFAELIKIKLMILDHLLGNNLIQKINHQELLTLEHLEERTQIDWEHLKI
jgi:hypothetical protein